MQRQTLTPQQATQKIRHFCAYQERCHHEVREKLYGFGLHTPDVDAIISDLIQENYLNEERFAIQFAGGKFRVKQWGRVKIRFELKQKQVSEYCIKKALSSIDEDDYLKTLEQLAQNKLATLKKEKNLFIRKKKLRDHLQQKGYESAMVLEIVNRF